LNTIDGATKRFFQEGCVIEGGIVDREFLTCAKRE